MIEISLNVNGRLFGSILYLFLIEGFFLRNRFGSLGSDRRRRNGAQSDTDVAKMLVVGASSCKDRNPHDGDIHSSPNRMF